MVYEEYYSNTVHVDFWFREDPGVPGMRRYQPYEKDNPNMIPNIIESPVRKFHNSLIRYALPSKEARASEYEKGFDNLGFSLHIANRQIRAETRKYMFRNPLFSFSCVGGFRKFMHDSRLNICFITKLALDIRLNPRPTPESLQRSVNAGKIVKALPEVTVFYLKLFVCEYKFTFNEIWAHHVFAFSAWNLEKVDVNIISPARVRCMRQKIHSAQDMRDLKTVELIHDFFERSMAKKMLGNSDMVATKEYREWSVRAKTALETALQVRISYGLIIVNVFAGSA
jgi:hypothetical protein